MGFNEQGPDPQLSDPPERMAGRNSINDRHVNEQGAAAILLASHLDWAIDPSSRGPDFSANSKSNVLKPAEVLIRGVRSSREQTVLSCQENPRVGCASTVDC